MILPLLFRIRRRFRSVPVRCATRNSFTTAINVQPIGTLAVMAMLMARCSSFGATPAFANLPLYFESNIGQARNPALFIARNGQAAFDLSPAEVVISLRNSDNLLENGHSSLAQENRKARTLRFHFLGANPNASMTGVDPLKGEVNYLTGNNPSNWQKRIPTFSSVEVENAYPGINLVHYGNQHQLEYDFIISPGTDPGAISIQIEGQDQIDIDQQGDLLIKVGTQVIRQKKPTLYQMQQEQRKEIQGGYCLRDKNTIVFRIGSYDRALPLVIDPVLAYSTLLGGLANDAGRALALDSGGNIYIAGSTLSTQLGTPNAYQPGYANGYPGAGGDAFVAKFDSTGSNLLFLTYLGGNGDDSATGIALDSEGNAYITGVTDSTNFPIPNLTVKNRIGGPGERYFGLHPYDGFVAKLSTDGSHLVYATYLGGNARDECLAIFVDSNACAYVTGFTESKDFPTTADAFQKKLQGTSDAFVTKVASNGMSFLYSTLLGGTNIEHGQSIAVDSIGRAYVTGSTRSTNFPVSANSFQTNGADIGSSQAFVTVIGADGAAVVRSTYLGGAGNASGSQIALDNSGNVYVAGSETGPGFPITPGGINPGGIFKTSDAAGTWAPSGAGLLHNQVHAIGVDPVNPLNLYIGTGRGIARSSDAGSSWQTSLDTFDQVVTLAIDPLKPSTIYAGATQILKSTNAGLSWFSSSTGLPKSVTSPTNRFVTINKLIIDPLSPETLYAGTENGIFKSTNAAANWRPANTGLGSFPVNDLVLEPSEPSILYAATTAGVFWSTNGGARWRTFNEGLTNIIPNALTVDSAVPSTVFLGTADGRLYKRSGGATNWLLLTTGLISTNSFFSNSIPLGSITLLAVDPGTSTTIYAGTRGGLFKSLDGGTNWILATHGLPGLPVAALAIDPKTPSNLYIGTFNTFAGTDAFLTRFNPDLSSISFSVAIGGSGVDQATGLALDVAGNIYVAGSTTSFDFPTLQPIGYPNSFNSGLSDAFVAAIKSDGSGFLYATYLGGAGDDFATGIALDSGNNAWVVGETFSPDFPTTPPSQPLRGPGDAFLAKLGMTELFVDVTLETIPPGIPLFVDGTTNTTPITFHWAVGSFHSLAAIPQSAGTNVQYAWVSWSDGGSLFHNIKAASNTNITASFKVQYYLAMGSTNITTTDSVLATNSGAVLPLSGWYDAGTNVTIKAIPPLDNIFESWIGAGAGAFTGLDNPVTITMNGPISETAIFSGPLTNRLKVTILGRGTLSPNLNGKSLVVGRTYTMTALPGPGYAFSTWRGTGLESHAPKLTFVMTKALVLEAEFVPTPFRPIAGSYAGLFYNTNVVAFDSSGFFSANITTQGLVTAKLQMAARTFPLSGQFTTEGEFSAIVPRLSQSSLSISLQVDMSGTNNFLTGQISSGTWTAQLLANRSVFSKTNPPPQAGEKYTVTFPGSPDSRSEPGGDGYGTVTVDNSGNIMFAGKLGDGTAVSQKAFLSREGQWPFYISLYAGRGLVIGWLTLSNQPQSDINGLVEWFKLPRPFTGLYESGFAIQSDAVGSRYLFTNGVPILPLNGGNGQIVLENGSLTQPITNSFALDSANRISTADKLTLTFTSASGLFRGTAVDLETGRSIPFSGAVLQKQNRGAGLFRLSEQTGRVILEPQE